ncbi:prolyl 4-hydroxylase, partial [Paragonimus westermani]
MSYVRLSILGISLFVPSPNWLSRLAVRNQTATMHNFSRISSLLPASLFSLILLCLQSNAEYYTAISELNKALQVGQQLAADLETYLELEEVRLDRIRRVAKRLETDGLVPKLAQDPEDFFGNPVNAYLTVRRLALNWKTDLLSLLDSHAEQNTDEQKEEGSLSVDKEELAKVRARVEEHTSMLPGDNDLSGAAEALLRLQTTYKLSAVDIANGKLINNLTCPRLTASQCLNLGQQAYELGEFARAEEWFRVAYNRLWEELAKAEELKKTGYTEHSSEKKTAEAEQDFDFAIPDEVQPTATEILDHLAYSLGRIHLTREAGIMKNSIAIEFNAEKALSDPYLHQK